MNLKKLLVFVFLFAICFTAHYAHADDLSFAGSNSIISVTNVPKSVTGLQISGTTPSSTPVKLRVTSGTLAMSTMTGLTFSSATTGSTLEFSGTLTNINAALATLTYTRVGTGTDTIEASLVSPGEVFFSGNDHLYEYIASSLDWNGALTTAGNLTRYGATGYLATITSQLENDFVSERLGGAGWMGASDAAQENDWKWVTGPENGTSFWSGGIGGSTVPGQYSNWNTNEPNDSGSNEDCAQFLAGGSGKWNDLPCSGTPLAGYVVEFGAPGNMPTVVSKNISVSTVSGPLAPTGATIVNPTTTTLDIQWTSGSGSETFFLIEQSEGDCSGVFSQIASIGSSTTTHTATNLSPETEYCFRVRSTNGSTYSSYSTTTSDFTFPNTPVKPTITNITTTSLAVRLPTDGNLVSGANASLYSIEEAVLNLFADYPNGGLVGGEGFTSSAAWNNNTVTGLTPNTAYSFKTRIAHRNSAGGYSSYSPTSDAVYTLTSVPTLFTATGTTQSSATFSWSGDGTSYAITNDTTGVTTAASGTSAELTGLHCGRVYTFRIKALNGDGTASDYSPSIDVTTSTCPPGGVSGGSAIQAIATTPAIISTPAVTIGARNACATDQILTQDLKAPSRNGRYSSYTKAVVTEAKILQNHLNRLGFQSGVVDGIIGPVTDGAIKRLQVFLGTLPDGLIGPITRGLLNNSCN
jgi:hypothetical protein